MRGRAAAGKKAPQPVPIVEHSRQIGVEDGIADVATIEETAER
jgi:hypothetical protein